jgi:hypothetical protein
VGVDVIRKPSNGIDVIGFGDVDALSGVDERGTALCRFAPRCRGFTDGAAPQVVLAAAVVRKWNGHVAQDHRAGEPGWVANQMWGSRL